MKRRDFLLKSAVAGCVLPSAFLNSCENFSVASDSSGQPTINEDRFELNEMSIEALQQKMENREYTSRALVEMYLRRIKEIDHEGFKLNSVIEINPDAVSLAERLDEERGSGQVRGPLHGIPFLLKDNIDTGDRMMTTAGSLALEGTPAAQDAFIARKLRDAGAIILGKANLSEWANIRSMQSTSGWSARGGQGRNPYVLDRNAYGSSTGSAVAVAANLIPIAVGTETDGSIVAPASVCSLVGIKPTVGLVSRTG